MATEWIRIRHRPSGVLIAEGRTGWSLLPLEGSFYIAAARLRQGRFETTPMPGLCPYKGLYLWLDYVAPGEMRESRLGWRYILPNPLLPVIAWRVALPQKHPALAIERGPLQSAGPRLDYAELRPGQERRQ